MSALETSYHWPFVIDRDKLQLTTTALLMATAVLQANIHAISPEDKKSTTPSVPDALNLCTSACSWTNTFPSRILTAYAKPLGRYPNLQRKN
ncbi:MAG: hypothetical protein WEC84_01370 [Candidatus Andersenbacteria bacterium]